jgi:DNA-binding XRE family transcriptional regulator
MQRLAEKEAKNAVRKLRKEVMELRRAVSQQEKRIHALEAGKGRAAKEKPVKAAQSAPAYPPAASETDRIRPSGRMVRNLRAKLGLTQAELAQLLGVSGQSVYQWERKDGPLTLRAKTRRALIEVRGMGVREARRRLEATA